MNWQIFLTVWLVVQLVVGVCSQPKLNKLKNQTEGLLKGSIGGVALKFVGMFLCLYMGGFYGE